MSQNKRWWEKDITIAIGWHIQLFTWAGHYGEGEGEAP